MRWFPNSLSLRLFLIIVGGVVLAVALTTTLAQRERVKAFGAFRLQAAIGHLGDVISLLAQLPAASRAGAATALPQREWFIDFDGLPGEAQGKPAPQLAWLLAKRLGGLARVEAARLDKSGDCDREPPPCRHVPATALVRIRFADGQLAWVGYRRVRERPPPHEQRGFWINIALFVAILAAATWLAVRISLRPLRRMTQAADDFGRDITHPPMDESGPFEVRRAAQAFNAMQERIRSHVAERTQILAAVTHDLKTPLTRMQLRLEHITDPVLKSRLREDVASMRMLVDEGLELARSLDTGEPAQPIDLDSLLQSLCEDAGEAGHDALYEDFRPDPEGQPLLVLGRPNALRRVFTNLIDNAIQYGRWARVSLRRRGDRVEVRIRDGGPGIPEERLQEVLQPFVRLETSRSRDTGGTGLGLAIAANLLRTQQGNLTLRNLPQGGLEASVDLALALAYSNELSR